MKIFMLWDMEGTSGLHRRPQAWYWLPDATPEDQETGRSLLEADINTAVAAALEAGADEVIVCDTHHGGNNVRIDRMPVDPRVTSLGKAAWGIGGRRLWMPGLDESVDGFMLPGHHAKAGTPNAFLPHQWSRTWAGFRINGLSVGRRSRRSPARHARSASRASAGYDGRLRGRPLAQRGGGGATVGRALVASSSRGPFLPAPASGS